MDNELTLLVGKGEKILYAGKPDEAAFFIIPFMALHMMPVWLYLGGALLSFRRYRNTERA